MYIDAYGYVSLTVDAFLYQKTKQKNVTRTKYDKRVSMLRHEALLP